MLLLNDADDMHYTVRLAQETDITRLAEVERAAARRFTPYLKQLDIPPTLLEGLVSPRFLRQAQQEGRLWVAAIAQQPVAQQPVGFIVTKFLPQSCFVVELDVHPNYGRRGIGSALIEACCQDAKARGFRRVTLTTFRHIPWNIPFYQRLGFELMPPEAWSPEIRAIVAHETRYGFKLKNRAVMGRWLTT